MPEMPTWLVAIAATVLALIALDRVALKAETRGWIYWRRRGAESGAVVLGPIFEALHPAHMRGARMAA